MSPVEVAESRDRVLAREISDDPTPWVQLKNLLARQIADRVLEPGDQVVLYLEAQDFGINQRSALKAFRALVGEGKLPPPAPGQPYTVAPASGPEAAR
jgi:hypothetical protein